MLVKTEGRILRVLLFSALLIGCQPPSEIPNANAEKSPSAQPGQRSVPMIEQGKSPDNSDLRIDVSLKNAIIRAGESNTVVMTMLHRGNGPLYVRHPMLATEVLGLDIRLPSGNSLVLRYPPRIPGVPPRVVNAELQPGVQQKFEIDLVSILPLDMAGTYTLRVEYPWKAGETWRSPSLTFTVR